MVFNSGMMDSAYQGLDQIFHPRSIAVIGASNRTGNTAGMFLKAHRVLNFNGPIYAVAPTGDEIPDFPSFRSLNDIPGPVDHVIIAVPAMYLPGVISDCVQKKVRSVAIFTSGFSETGEPEGMELEKMIREKARESGMRVIGPNCMGIYYPQNGMSFRADRPPGEGPGEVSYLSQSGGMAFGAIFLGNRFGLKYHKVVSYGNEVDLCSPELLDYFTEDPETKIILTYIEGTRDGRALAPALIRAGAKKPVVVLKGGLSETGVRAAASHTGGKRFRNAHCLERYLDDPSSAGEEEERLDDGRKAGEEAVLRLRLIEEGLDIKEMACRYGQDSINSLEARLDELVSRQMLVRDGYIFRLPTGSALTSNSVFITVIG